MALAAVDSFGLWEAFCLGLGLFLCALFLVTVVAYVADVRRYHRPLDHENEPATADTVRAHETRR
jgi:hypothetical protein